MPYRFRCDCDQRDRPLALVFADGISAVDESFGGKLLGVSNSPMLADADSMEAVRMEDDSPLPPRAHREYGWSNSVGDLVVCRHCHTEADYV